MNNLSEDVLRNIYKTYYNKYVLVNTTIENIRDFYPSEYFTTKKLYVPLNFWFNRNTQLAIPEVSLQYHNINININFNELQIN